MSHPHMSHQVLARKWRPRSFQEMVGQTPVIQALINALEQNRLHHAYLFTGTRGVGKTSLARLLAKCLNCESGVTANPCGQCANCQAIEQGRFLDLQEIDAASRTKVEDTRDLLDNVQYAPTQGRYKVYLIDEVHMLSNHSFNALLKTLEEPPPHVKFLLATTDPQRLPVTVLSRCLQFHLKNLSSEQITQQLSHILEQEQIPYDEKSALHYLAHAAQGSMRDALSLLDQAIAYGNGKIVTQEIKTLLGATEPELIIALLQALADRDAQQLLTAVEELANSAADFPKALEELLSLLHQITLQQMIPALSNQTLITAQHLAKVTELARTFTAEQVQLYYQMGLIGRRDLHLAPTARTGFEMILLRMLAMSPQALSTTSLKQSSSQATPAAKEPRLFRTAAQPVAEAAPTTAAIRANETSALPGIAQAVSPQKSTPHADTATTPQATTTVMEHVTANPAIAVNSKTFDTWADLLPNLHLQGVAAMVASHCVLVQKTTDEIHLLLDSPQTALLSDAIKQRIATALEQYFNHSMRLRIEIGKPNTATPAILDKHRQEQQQSAAVAAIAADKHVQDLMSQFNAQIIHGSVETKE